MRTLKFAAGTIPMGLAFLLFLPFTWGGPNSTPLLALIGIVRCSPSPNCCFPPRPRNVTTKLAPEAFHTQMVALFYLPVSMGTAISGELARFYTAENEGTDFGAAAGSLSAPCLP